jgi:hypothetical protein
MPKFAEADAGVGPASAPERDHAARLIGSELTQAHPRAQQLPAPTPAIRIIPVGVRGLVRPLPDRSNFNARKRNRRRAWLAQIASEKRGHDEKRGPEWLCAKSVITGIRLYGRRLTVDYLARDTGLSGKQVMAALYELRRRGHLGWSCRGAIFYIDPKMRAPARG